MNKKARSFARLLFNDVSRLRQFVGKLRGRIDDIAAAIAVVAEGITCRTSCGTTTRAATVRMRMIDTLMPFCNHCVGICPFGRSAGTRYCTEAQFNAACIGERTGILVNTEDVITVIIVNDGECRF